MAAVEEAEESERSVKSRRLVADRDRNLGRRFFRAGHQDIAGLSLDDHVIGFLVAVRAVLAEAGNMTIDNVRLDRPHGFVIDAEPSDDAGLEILDDHIGLGRKLEEDLPPFVGFQIERERFFIAVEEDMGGGEAPTGAIPMARQIAAKRLDLDHLSPHIGQHARTPRPRRADLDGQHLNCGERRHGVPAAILSAIASARRIARTTGISTTLPSSKATPAWLSS